MLRIQESPVQQLIDAASSGDLNAVQRLANKAIVNELGRIRNWQLTSGTALSAAVSQNHLALVSCLLKEKSARVDSQGKAAYSYDTFAANALLAYCFNGQQELRNPSIFKLLIEHAEILTPICPDAGLHSIVDYFDLSDPIKRSQNDRMLLSGEWRVCLSLLLHEATLRNERGIIERISKIGNIDVSKKTLQEYLGERKLSVQELQKAHQGIDHLVKCKTVIPSVASELKVVFSEHVRFQLNLEAFPEELRPMLQKPSNRSLQELFAELQHWLYPEDKLPPFVVTADSFGKFSREDYPDQIEYYQNYQHPKQFTSFLKLDRAIILMRLHRCKPEQEGVNPAALLLAQIILFHHKEIITHFDGTRKPLLTENECKAAIGFLQELYHLTDDKALILSCTMQLQAQNTGLIRQVNNLDEKVERLENALKTQTDLIQQMITAQQKLFIDLSSKGREPIVSSAVPKTMGFFQES